MVLGIDTSGAFRTTEELGSLVLAVLGATEHDETDWLEMKSTLDLTTAEGKFTIAKTILGFANRSVEVAAQHCEGCAYLIAGADHDGLHGVTETDIASLEQSLAPYLGTGDDAPRWSARYLRLDECSVLIVVVEPPRNGQRIRTLRRSFGKFHAGAAFIRGQAKTQIATPDEIRMLEDRLTRGLGDPEMALEVSFSVSDDLLVQLADYADEAVAEVWIERARRRLLAAAEGSDRSTRLDPVAALMAQARSATEGAARREYATEVEQYLRKCRQRLVPAAIRSIVNSRSNGLSARVTNRSQTTAAAVRVAATIPRRSASLYDRSPEGSELPEPPDWLQKTGQRLRIPRGIARAPIDPASLQRRAEFRVGEATVRVDDDVTRAVWLFGDLHAGQSEVGDSLTVIPSSEEPIDLEWSATASNRKGQAVGSFRIDVAPGSCWSIG